MIVLAIPDMLMQPAASPPGQSDDVRQSGALHVPYPALAALSARLTAHQARCPPTDFPPRLAQWPLGRLVTAKPARIISASAKGRYHKMFFLRSF